MPNRGEFRATTDQLLAILDELRSIEEQKRVEALGSAAFMELAKQATAQSRLAFRWCQMQEQMAADAGAKVARGEQAHDIRLVEVTPRPIDRILANWREAQLRLEIAQPGSPEAAAATEQIELLREEYQASAAFLADAAADLSAAPGRTRDDGAKPS
jgi:hypothetical protein